MMPAEGAAAEATGLGQRTDILLIEDEQTIAEAVRFILTREGWGVSAISDGAGAMAAMRDLRPRLLVLDLMLPNRSGHEILTELRGDAVLSATPVLLLTAQGQEAAASAAALVDAVLAKPFANDDLRALVRRLMG